MFMTKKIQQMLIDEAAKTSKKDIAARLNVSGATMTEWTTNGFLFLRENNARALCDFLGISYDLEIKNQLSAINHVAPSPAPPSGSSSSSVTGNGNAVTTGNGSATIQNIGYCSPPEGFFTPMEIVRKVSTCDATDSEKGTTISVLGRCGIL